MNTRETRHLSVTLTVPEVALRSRQLALVVDDYNRLEAEQKAAAKVAREKLLDLRAKVTSLASTVETGREVREVTGTWMRARGGLTMQWVRDDTLEVCDEREATAEERQDTLFDRDPVEH